MPLEITQETAQKIHNELVKANQLASQGRRSEAKAICLSVFDLCPDYPDTNQILGLIYLQDLDFYKAAEHLRQAVKLVPEQPGVWLWLGQALREIRQPEEARKAYETALKYAPQFAEGHFRLGEMALALGKTGQAKAAFQEAIKNDPKMGQAFRQLTKILDAEEAADLMPLLQQNLLEPGDTTHIALANMAFALGSCLDKTGKFEAAGDLFAAARVMQGANPAWRQSYAEKFKKTKEVFTGDVLKRTVPVENQVIKPIFIVGIPRSGSTLLEQILASHSKIFGSDEVRFSEALFKELNALLPNKIYPENVPDLSVKQLTALSEKYQANLGGLSENHTVFTDKMLSNFHILGLLKMLFPESRVINITRNAADTAASISRNIFSIGAAPYLGGPAEIGVYMRQYSDLMDFWRSLLPGFILDVSYEELVNNSEVEVKKILDFCGLEFEKGCLAFSKSQRPVYSPSASQVRQRLYDTSIGRGENEAGPLEPFHLTFRGIEPLPKSEEVKKELQEASEKIKEFKLDRAEEICTRILKTDPHQAYAMKGLGAIALERQKLDTAAAWFRKSLTFEPRQPGLWVSLGEALTGAGQAEAATHAFFMARVYNPENAEALYWLARLDIGSGNPDAAEAKLAKAIAIDPENMAAYDLSLRIKGFSPDEKFLRKLETAANEGGRSEIDTIYANYALATHFRERDEEKFRRHLKRANDLQSQIAPNVPDFFGYAASVAKSHFNEGLLKAAPAKESGEITPVFIVGLPRSGSSLLEQMLGSHKSIAAGDEIPFLNAKLIARLESLTGQPYPEGIQNLKRDQWQEIGGVYQDAVKTFSKGKPFVTDKMLSNGLFLGPAFLAMPWAKAIHIRRNYLDTAFSIYRHYFTEKLKFAHDPEALADYARRMEATMDHWKTLWLKNIHEVTYEDLVANPEKVLKGVFGFLDLKWDSGVLDYHKTVRPMQTLSLAQVTEPIYTSGQDQWQDYADLLEPFRKAAGDLIDKKGFLKR